MGQRVLDITQSADTGIDTDSVQLTRGTLTSVQIVKTNNASNIPKFSYVQASLHHNNETAQTRIIFLTAGNILLLSPVAWDGEVPIDENMLLVLSTLGYTGDVYRLTGTIVDPITGSSGIVRDP